MAHVNGSERERERFEVILERIETKIAILADGHFALHEKFDRLESKVDQLASEVTFLRVDLGTVKHRVENIEHQLGLNGASKARKSKPAARTPERRKRKQGVKPGR